MDPYEELYTKIKKLILSNEIHIEIKDDLLMLTNNENPKNKKKVSIYELSQLKHIISSKQLSEFDIIIDKEEKNEVIQQEITIKEEKRKRKKKEKTLLHINVHNDDTCKDTNIDEVD